MSRNKADKSLLSWGSGFNGLFVCDVRRNKPVYLATLNSNNDRSLTNPRGL